MLNIAVRAARNAGQVVVKAFSQPENIEVIQKGSNDFVTNVDRDAEAAIIHTIKNLTRNTASLLKSLARLPVPIRTTNGSSTHWMARPTWSKAFRTLPFPSLCASRARPNKPLSTIPSVTSCSLPPRAAAPSLNGYRIRVGKAKELSGTIPAPGSRSSRSTTSNPT